MIYVRPSGIQSFIKIKRITHILTNPNRNDPSMILYSNKFQWQRPHFHKLSVKLYK